MVADKRVQIAVPENPEEGLPAISLEFLRVTEVKVSEELDSDIVKTFDEPVTVPSNNGGYSIDISALEARNLDHFKNLKKIIKRMKTETGSISIFETIKHKDGNFETEYHFTGVSLTSNEVSYDSEDLTARDLSFNAEAMREIVDGDEI
jgi:hypothetical protein